MALPSLNQAHLFRSFLYVALPVWAPDTVTTKKKKKNLEMVYVNTLYFKIHKFIFVRYG